MKLLKRIRDWWNRDPDSLEAFLERAEKANTGEPQEIWQWQINCVSNRFPRHKPMPKNFGLLIGTRADAEKRLKASVSLPNYEISVNHCYSSQVITYDFTSAEWGPVHDYIIQRGAIRCVSENRKLIKTGFPDMPHSIREFIIESDNYNSDFDFHPIKPQERFIKAQM